MQPAVPQVAHCSTLAAPPQPLNQAENTLGSNLPFFIILFSKLAVINNFVLLQMLSFSSLTSGQTWSMGFVCAPAAPSPAAQASSIKYGADLRLNSYYHRCSSFLVNSLYVLELSQLGLSFAPAAFVGLWYLFWVLAKNRLWGIFLFD